MIDRLESSAGKIDKLTFNLGPVQYTAQDRESFRPLLTGLRARKTNRMKNLLTVAAVLEAVTGVALILVPSLVGHLLLGTELTGGSIPIAWVTGIALIALSVACLPGSTALSGMLAYSALITLFFLYLGIRGEWVGPLLWPAAVLHAVLTFLLASVWRNARKGGRSAKLT